MSKSKATRYILILAVFFAVEIIAWLVLHQNTPSEGQASYVLAWDWGDAQATQDGWRTTTNLGYDVEVTTGYVVAHETQMTPCEHSHGWLSWLTLDINTAHAGHGDDSNDSTFELSRVENLINPQSETWGTVTLYEPTYCEAFFLIARGEADSLNSPDDVDMYGTSVYLQGTYVAPEHDEPIAFTLQTGHANGIISEFSHNSDSVHIALSDEPLEIAITRSLDSMLDDIDFVSMTTDDAAFQVLRNLVNNTTFEILSGKTHTN